MGWDDSCGCYGTQDIQSIANASDPTHPMLVVQREANHKSDQQNYL